MSYMIRKAIAQEHPGAITSRMQGLDLNRPAIGQSVGIQGQGFNPANGDSVRVGETPP